VPGDLLRYVGGPGHYSPWWLWLGLALLTVVIAWYASVFVATMPGSRLRRIRVLRDVHGRLLRRRYAGTIRRITDCRRRGELTDTQAYGQMSQTVRSFLQQATGIRAPYLHIDEIGAGSLAPAAPLIAALRDARFDTTADADPEDLGAQAEELIRSWT
jgi:hypothetical protein